MCTQGGDRRKLPRERGEDENELKRRKTKFASIILIYTRLFFSLLGGEDGGYEASEEFLLRSSCPGLERKKNNFCTFSNLMKEIFLISMMLFLLLEAEDVEEAGRFFSALRRKFFSSYN